MERMRGTRVVYLGTICEARGHDDAMMMVPPSYPDVPLTKCNALLCRAQFDLIRTEMPFALLALFALLGRSAGEHSNPAENAAAFSSPPQCAAVWNPASPPAVADPTILATVAAADAQGAFSGGNGPVLQGTVPFDVYIQIIMGVVFGGMPGDTPTAAQQQCLATLGQAMGVNSSLTPIFITDSKCICERSAALTCDPPMSAAADCIVIAPSGDGCPMRPV